MIRHFTRKAAPFVAVLALILARSAMAEETTQALTAEAESTVSVPASTPGGTTDSTTSTAAEVLTTAAIEVDSPSTRTFSMTTAPTSEAPPLATATEVLTAPLAARHFARIVSGMLSPEDTVYPVGNSQVVVTASTSTLERIKSLTKSLDTQTTGGVTGTLRAALFVQAGVDDVGSTAALTREVVQKELARFGISTEDVADLPLPEAMRRAGETWLPFNESGEISAPLDDTYYLQINESGGNPQLLELEVMLTRRTAALEAVPVLHHRFRLARGKAVVLGLSTRGQVLLLAVSIR